MEVEPERGDGSRGRFPGSSSSSSGRSGSSFVVFFSSVFLLLLLSFLLAAAAGGRPPWRRRERHPDVEPGRVRRREALGRRRGRLGGAAAVAEEVARVGGEAPRERRWRGTPLLSSLSSSSSPRAFLFFVFPGDARGRGGGGPLFNSPTSSSSLVPSSVMKNGDSRPLRAPSTLMHLASTEQRSPPPTAPSGSGAASRVPMCSSAERTRAM